MKRIALTVLALGSPLILLAFLVGGPIAEGLFVSVGLTFPVALSALGAERGVGLRRVLIGLGALLQLSAAGVLLLGPGDAAGLPLTTWLMLLGLGLAPLILVTLGFAATFREPRPPARD